MSQRIPPYWSGFQNHSGRRAPPPASPRALNNLMRRDVDGLNHLADRALPHQLPRVHGRLHLQQFAVEDGVDPLGLGDGLAHLGQLLERRHARLVREKILAVLHGAHGQRRPLAGNLRAEHQLHRRVVQNLILRRGDLYVWKPLFETGQLVVLAAPGRHQLAAAALDGADHAVNMVVAHAAHGKLDVILGRLFSLRGRQHRIFDNPAASAPESHRAFRHAGHHGYRRNQSGLLQKVTPARRNPVHLSSVSATAWLNQAATATFRMEHNPPRRISGPIASQLRSESMITAFAG